MGGCVLTLILGLRVAQMVSLERKSFDKQGHLVVDEYLHCDIPIVQWAPSGRLTRQQV